MKKNLFLLLAFTFCGQLAFSQKETTTLSINKAEKPVTINKNIYGHFAEHLGRCIYGGFFVGDTSKIPNTNGVRNDIIANLKELKISNLRWPGDTYFTFYPINCQGFINTIIRPSPSYSTTYLFVGSQINCN